MNETVRVILNGDLAAFLAEWNRTHEFQLDRLTVPELPSDSPVLLTLRSAVRQFPAVQLTEFVERTYSKQELLAFDGYVLWPNAKVAGSIAGPGAVRPVCPGCGYLPPVHRTGPAAIKGTGVQRKDVAETDDSELIVSPRLAEAFQAHAVEGVELTDVRNVRGQLHGAALRMLRSVDEYLPDTLHYTGERCLVCGRYEQAYAKHPSQELWLPGRFRGIADVAYLNAGLVRSRSPRILISNKVLRVLQAMRATGFWVQPIHFEE